MPIGLDVGTGNLVAADTVEIAIQRNAFLTIPKQKTTKRQLKRMKVPYIEIDDQLHLIGQDAFEYANIFNTQELRRPMKSGLLNPTEQDALPILKHMIGSLVGSSETKETVCYSVPGTAIDQEREVDYHKDVIYDILDFFGFHPLPINEAVALGNVGLDDNELTGIAISFGAGMANICVMYKGLSAIQFSVAKSGDWISEQIATDTGISVAKANYAKESGEYSISPYATDRRTREQQAAKTYYEALIRYILANITAQFEASADTPTFPNQVPIVCGGGTAMVDGFVEVFKDQFTDQDFPIDVGEIILVDEPLTAVARGCLIEAEFEDE